MKNDDGVVTARKSGKVMNGYWLLLAIEIFMVLDADARARGWRRQGGGRLPLCPSCAPMSRVQTIFLPRVTQISLDA